MKTTRKLAAAATTAALGLSVLTASPAEAGVTRSFSESASDGSASWGTITFSNYSWSVDAYIYRDSNATITLEVCGHQTLNNGSWGLLTCKSASNGGSIGSTRHVTTLSGSADWAKVGMVTTYLYVNGVYADGDWNYAF
ncbi:hypothetical protein [Microbispora catharanthi]|uniref:Uncharacterized protein n=1 Tax=Microbispora catharanthi TaxID=1712871 RepID=A0A5N6BN35_9ACTN|nr:hypothetical protein [Microbispora catharanthi]KAB8181894.1 hypothetical protein FH610_025990 [Microbispora catharanthi]